MTEAKSKGRVRTIGTDKRISTLKRMQPYSPRLSSSLKGLRLSFGNKSISSKNGKLYRQAIIPIPIQHSPRLSITARVTHVCCSREKPEIS
jgi:hypothetical protein